MLIGVHAAAAELNGSIEQHVVWTGVAIERMWMWMWDRAVALTVSGLTRSRGDLR